MRSRFGWIFVGLAACTSVNSAQDSGGPPPEPTPVTTPPPPVTTPTPSVVTPPPVTDPTPPAAGAVTVQMTAATLADDCGGPPAAPKVKAKEMAAGASSRRGAMARRACEQSSMQLSVVAAAGGAASQLAVKKVELFDDKGTLIGELTARTPSVWDENGTYQAWDQNVAPGQELSVSYALSEPPWRSVPDRRNRNYVLKAVITVGGGEQAIQRDVQVDAPTILPPNVKT